MSALSRHARFLSTYTILESENASKAFDQIPRETAQHAQYAGFLTKNLIKNPHYKLLKISETKSSSTVRARRKDFFDALSLFCSRLHKSKRFPVAVDLVGQSQREYTDRISVTYIDIIEDRQVGKPRFKSDDLFEDRLISFVFVGIGRLAYNDAV